MMRRPLTWSIKVGLLAALLAAHFWTRYHSTRQVPLTQRGDYLRSYAASLSLLAGHGFHDLPLLDAPSARPVKEFLSYGRDRLGPRDLEAYFRSPAAPDPDPSDELWRRFLTSRVVDLHVAALVWKLFGISWLKLYACYCLASTATCLLIFLIARRLAGSYGAGLIAAAVFFVSPLETYLGCHSIRDTSPLWFAAAGFYLLTCVVDRFRRPAVNGLSFLALGAVSTLGLGYRWDAAILAPVLGAGLLAVLIRKRHGLRYVLTALTLFGGGAYLAVAAINAPCSSKRMGTNGGYLIAYYGDFTRCNLLGLENSFQVHWCDMQTLYEARQLACVERGGTPLSFTSEEFYRQCKEMYLASLRYNLYAYVRHFPEVYFRLQGGLADPGTLQGVAAVQARGDRPEAVAHVYTLLVDPVLPLLPYLFLVGVAAALLVLPEKTGALFLALFSVYFAAIFLVILPMQKHMALMLLPLSVFAGIGLWTAARWCRPHVWRQAPALFRSRPLKVCLGGTALLFVLWSAACLVARPLSRAERDRYLEDVRALARQGVPAPETIKGKQTFSVQIPPGQPEVLPGYLLTLRTGDQPGPLQCRHLHHPRDLGWPRVYVTRHHLHPNRTQYFFVSCYQGSGSGDPRPYSCTVFVDGAAEIVACTRVDMARWDHLQLSTVFYDGEHCPGSPPVDGISSEFSYPVIPVFAAETPGGTLAPPSERPKFSTRRLTGVPGKPLQHLLGRDRASGAWRCAFSDGWSFTVQTMGAWSPAVAWADVLIGDFDGDGMSDVVGREPGSGTWWVAAPDGVSLPNRPWGAWAPGTTWADVCVGDFNGDGLDDLVGRVAATGEWWVALSTGRKFDNCRWGQWAPEVAWMHVRAGDFDGDGRCDLAGHDPATGRWWVARSRGDRFENQVWGTWPAGAAWQHVCLGDFDGDGRCDLAGYDPATRQWWVALSRATSFDCRAFGRTEDAANWRDVAVGDVNGDGRADLIGWDEKTGQCWVAVSGVDGFAAHAFGLLPTRVQDFHVGDFNGDGRTDIAWRDPATGTLWVGLSDGTAFRFQAWGNWPLTDQLSLTRTIGFWR